MSGVSECRTCPKCGEEALECSDDHKREDHSGACLECGFSFNTVQEQMTLAEVNKEREEMGMEALSELAKQN